MSGPRVAYAVLRKDLLLDLRSRDRLGHMMVFSALVVVLLSISLPTTGPATQAWVPVLLWVVFLFTSLLGLSRSFRAETEAGAISLLVQAPCDRGWVFVGKAGANFVALLLLEVWTALLAMVFLEVHWGGAPLALVGVGALGAIALSGVGTLLSAMATSTRYPDFLLPIAYFPLILPVLVIASRLTAAILGDGTAPSLWWGALALYDWVFVLVAYFVFDYVLEE
jgi:heme exporter protein B